ncbi:carboxypeptidase-like regulatory domain-containing protein [uncultured Lutibacter sp.]|uniref:carboxypeptidase-like regulatory domain-containing protein n=1 Tax=uncultured Lutibacter sp. TaxID=437739 RepID=UPI002605226D|nr:carboxypeptidase-like regulatory domain-containing protein [uncultured Lutibacter sp.]
MNEKLAIIKNIAGFAITTGLSITTQGSSNLIIGALSGIVGGISNNFFDKIEFNKIGKLLQETDPSDLNHDLQKIMVKAVEWAILNIQILYKKELSDPTQIKELKLFTKSLLEEVKLLKNTLNEKGDGVYKIIENPTNENNLLKTFDLNIEGFPTINENNSYKNFFIKQFEPNLKLCFGELLKNEKNRPALIAYQREVYQNLDQTINKVIAQNELILQKLDDNKEKETIQKSNSKWNQVSKKIIETSFDQITPEFEASINNQIDGIKKDTQLLVDITGEIRDEIDKIKGITKGFSKELKQNWIAKNKVIIIALFAIISLCIIGLVYKIKTAPFQMNVGIMLDNSLEIHSEYPKLSEEARVLFYFPSETKEKEITFSNEIILSELSSNLKKLACEIELVDNYWEFVNDSMVLDNKAALLLIKPNEVLSEIKGKVISRDGQTLINNAKIIVDNIITYTNELGEFYIKVPINLRRIYYVIRVEKEGYISKEKSYVAGDAIEILISKN